MTCRLSGEDDREGREYGSEAEDAADKLGARWLLARGVVSTSSFRRFPVGVLSIFSSVGGGLGSWNVFRLLPRPNGIVVGCRSEDSWGEPAWGESSNVSIQSRTL